MIENSRNTTAMEFVCFIVNRVVILGVHEHSVYRGWHRHARSRVRRYHRGREETRRLNHISYWKDGSDILFIWSLLRWKQKQQWRSHREHVVNPAAAVDVFWLWWLTCLYRCWSFGCSYYVCVDDGIWNVGGVNRCSSRWQYRRNMRAAQVKWQTAVTCLMGLRCIMLMALLILFLSFL